MFPFKRAKKLLTMTDAIYPQFATHNAYSVALILNLVGDYLDFEFQCLHGMGNELYEQIVPAKEFKIPCRIYAPVGSHEDLLPYFVRRLLENGANSSFVNRIVVDNAPISELKEEPVGKAKHLLSKINQNIPLPSSIFLPKRKNSEGLDFSDREQICELQERMQHFEEKQWSAGPILADKPFQYMNNETVTSPQSYGRPVGQVMQSTLADVEWALTKAKSAFMSWSQTSVDIRANFIERIAELLEENKESFLGLACLEAGKTWSDGIAEVREAVDFCRYYASQAKKCYLNPQRSPQIF